MCLQHVGCFPLVKDTNCCRFIVLDPNAFRSRRRISNVGSCFFLFFFDNCSKSKFFEFDQLCSLNRDQTLIPPIWVRMVWFNLLHLFNLNKVPSGADAWVVLECVLGRSVFRSALVRSSRPQRHPRCTWWDDLPPELNSSHSSPPPASEGLSFQVSDLPHFWSWYFRLILWTDWVPGLIICL